MCDEPPSTTTGSFHLTIEVQYTLEFSKPIIDEPEDLGGIVNFPAGRKDVYDSQVIVADSGSPDWATQYHVVPFEAIIQLHPSISLGNLATFNDAPATLAYARVGTYDEKKGFLFYTTYESAVKAGTNPGRDATKNIKFVGDEVDFPPFKGAYYK